MDIRVILHVKSTIKINDQSNFKSLGDSDFDLFGFQNVFVLNLKRSNKNLFMSTANRVKPQGFSGMEFYNLRELNPPL